MINAQGQAHEIKASLLLVLRDVYTWYDLRMFYKWDTLQRKTIQILEDLDVKMLL